MPSNSNASIENENENENESKTNVSNVLSSAVASSANESNSSSLVARKPSPASFEGNADAAQTTTKKKGVKRKTPVPPPSEAPQKAAAPAQKADVEQKMPSAAKMPAVEVPPAEAFTPPQAIVLETPSLQTLDKDSYFLDLLGNMSKEQYDEYLRSTCDGDTKKLARMLVETARFYMDRCNNQMNLMEFLKSFRDGASSSVLGLVDASKLRNFFNNPLFAGDIKPAIPSTPALHLPPGMVPVNIHPSGIVGQCCIRGEEKCVAFANRAAPEFAQLSFSSSGGTSFVQYCPTCNDCYNGMGIDPSRTFETKAEFDAYMATYATQNDIKLTRATGVKISVGEVKMPRYLAVSCGKKSAHRNGSDCSCSFKVMATLKETANGAHRYCFNILDLDHS